MLGRGQGRPAGARGHVQHLRPGGEGHQVHQPAGGDLHQAEGIVCVGHGIEIRHDAVLEVVVSYGLSHGSHVLHPISIRMIFCMTLILPS